MSNSIGFGVGLSFLRAGGGTVPGPTGNWLLITGFWADTGVWDNFDTWRD